MRVPFLDLGRESRRCSADLERAARRVIERGWYILGPELEGFEREFAADAGVPYALGVASGTDAISLSLAASGCITSCGKDEVLTSALSAAFSALAILRAGAVPRFVDINLRTLQIDAALLESQRSERTRAILPVHLYGCCPDMPAIEAFARRHGLVLIEDACQAHGSRLGGKALGTLGLAGAFSFYPTKNLGALGDAGMVVTHDEELARRVKMLRHGGQSSTYCHELPGWNSRLDEIQAAILRCKLTAMEAGNSRRRALAARYDDGLAGLDLLLPSIPEGLIPNRHLYPVRTPRRDELRAWLKERGIETLVHYPVPLPMQPALRPYVPADAEFPAAERAARELLSLPLYPDLTGAEQDHVIYSVRNYFGGL